MREMKLRVQVMRPALASSARGALPLVGGVCWGVGKPNAPIKPGSPSLHSTLVKIEELSDYTVINLGPRL